MRQTCNDPFRPQPNLLPPTPLTSTITRRLLLLAPPQLLLLLGLPTALLSDTIRKAILLLEPPKVGDGGVQLLENLRGQLPQLRVALVLEVGVEHALCDPPLAAPDDEAHLLDAHLAQQALAVDVEVGRRREVAVRLDAAVEELAQHPDDADCRADEFGGHGQGQAYAYAYAYSDEVVVRDMGMGLWLSCVDPMDLCPALISLELKIATGHQKSYSYSQSSDVKSRKFALY